ncbi:MAG: winged helix-turn-helix domain-containing protein [Phycisphaerales bacterium]|nr:winged helix-turn-helix domain-containing protein [Phycisphaerales bacterium]
MRIAEHTPGDIERLSELIASEKHADRRDRYRIALLALRGREKLEIAEVLGIAKSTVEQWAYAYRDGGIAALAGRKRGGSRPKIDGDKIERLRARVEAGPAPHDKVCTLRGRDIQRIARDELDVDISLNGVYRTLHRLGYSCLAPRPRHEKQDLEAQRKFRETAPLL